MAQEAKINVTAISSLPIGKNKIFHELDVHHVKKVGIKRFWDKEAEMTLTTISSLDSASEKKIFNELDVHHI